MYTQQEDLQQVKRKSSEQISRELNRKKPNTKSQSANIRSGSFKEYEKYPLRHHFTILSIPEATWT